MYPFLQGQTISNISSVDEICDNVTLKGRCSLYVLALLHKIAGFWATVLGTLSEVFDIDLQTPVERAIFGEGLPGNDITLTYSKPDANGFASLRCHEKDCDRVELC